MDNTIVTNCAGFALTVRFVVLNAPYVRSDAYAWTNTCRSMFVLTVRFALLNATYDGQDA